MNVCKRMEFQVRTGHVVEQQRNVRIRVYCCVDTVAKVVALVKAHTGTCAGARRTGRVLTVDTRADRQGLRHSESKSHRHMAIDAHDEAQFGRSFNWG